jgi:hypothetical protein
MAVNRDKAKALPPEKLAELAKTDELELLYLHLHSMRNFPAMANRLAGKAPPPDDDGTAPGSKEDSGDKKSQARAK